MKRLKELYLKATQKLRRKEITQHIRLKDLDIVTADKIDYAYIVFHILGYEDKLIDKILLRRNKVLRKYYAKAIELVKEARTITPNHLELSEGCEITTPSHIDNISFVAMLELTAIIQQGITTTLSDLMAHIVTISCFSENYDEDYVSGSEAWEEFNERIKNADIRDMIAIYNWVEKELKASTLLWEKRFLQVQVIDEDYEQVNGAGIMSQFNVVNSLKSICSEFNVSYEKAWQVSYALVQTASLSRASSNYIQDEMRQIKETRMKREREKNRG